MSSSTTISKRKNVQRLAVILPNVPKGVNWGWYSREDTRMHLQTVDSKSRNVYKVWLESEGRRVFEPAGNFPSKVIKKLETTVMEERRYLEGRWVSFMIAQNWIELHVSGTVITVIAYPHVPGSRFMRTVDLVEWLPGIYNPASPMWPKIPVKPEEIGLNGEMAAIEIYKQKDESLRHHFFLPTIIWED